MEIVLTVIVGLVALVVGLLVGYILRKSIGEKTIGNAEVKAANIISSAETKAAATISDAQDRAETIRKEMILEAKEEAHEQRNALDKEIRERRNEISKSERRLVQKEESMDKKLENIERKEESILNKEKNINNKQQEMDKLVKKQLEELEQISGYTTEEAKEVILEKVEREARGDAAALYKEIENKAKEDAGKKAKEIITGAIQRCAADHVAESTVSVVPLPNDEMKGRIIGREGRNIRAIETLTGVDLIIDDTPEAVILSGFDPVRREIARLSLEKLIVDGRIHPGRIEEMVEKSEREINAIIKDAGEQATYEVGIHNLHPELIKLLGRLKYRTSYGQNVLKHSVEVSHLAGLMAGELGLDITLAKRAGLLHDIGKALDHEKEGTHVDIGMEVLKKYKEHDNVINAMAAHHGDYEPKSIEAVLIAAADALSAARPGARRETLESYVKRLQKLEEIANTTEGVDKSYAIQAGREIRIIAKPDVVNDEGIALMARDISKKIESELEYPGQIKVNVVRETRAVDYAK